MMACSIERLAPQESDLFAFDMLALVQDGEVVLFNMYGSPEGWEYGIVGSTDTRFAAIYCELSACGVPSMAYPNRPSVKSRFRFRLATLAEYATVEFSYGRKPYGQPGTTGACGVANGLPIG